QQTTQSGSKIGPACSQLSRKNEDQTDIAGQKTDPSHGRCCNDKYVTDPCVLRLQIQLSVEAEVAYSHKDVDSQPEEANQDRGVWNQISKPVPPIRGCLSGLH